jgi:hypothetical protein
MTAPYDVYLVLHDFCGNVDRYRLMVAALSPVGREYLPEVEVFYQASLDTALLALRFSPHAVAHLGEDSLHLLAHRSRLPMIVPACLDTPQRRRFFLEQLPSFEVHLTSGPADTLDHAIGDAPEPSPAEQAFEFLARRVPLLADPHALAHLSHSEDLPLFHPWWQRASTSDLSGN